MNKLNLIILFIFFNIFVSFSQTAVSTRTIRVASATTAFNQNIAVGTLVIDTTENKLFLAKASIAGLGDDSQTLKKAADSFELINETIINDSSSVVEVSEVEEYATGTTKGGTIFVVTSDDNDEVTITLSTTDVVGKIYRVKNISNNNGTVEVVTEGDAMIDGLDSVSTNVPFKGWTFQSDGINWYIIGQFGG
jgi:hypothetical protein